MILSPAQLALVRDRRKTRLSLPAEGKCPLVEGRVYRFRCQNAGWTAAELLDHREWAQDEHPSRARAVLAYLEDPLEAALTEPASVDVTVLTVALSSLGAVSQQGAQREGFRFVTHFRNHWESTHGVWDDGRPVWVVGFEVGDHRHTFDRPRLLKATPGTISGDPDRTPEHQDYTERSHLAMGGEPEGVDAKTLERFSAEGAAGHARRKAAELRWQQARSLRIRLHDAERRKDPEALDAVLRDLQRLDGLAA